MEALQDASSQEKSGGKKTGQLLSAWGTTLLFPICLQCLHSIAKLFECLPISRVYFHVTVREVERLYLHFPSAEPKRSDAF